MFIDTAWHAYGRQTVVVGKHGVFRRKGLRLTRFLYRWSGCCRGWQQQNIDVVETFAGNRFAVGRDIGDAFAEISKWSNYVAHEVAKPSDYLDGGLKSFHNFA